MSIPLTALQVQQQPGPLEQYGKVMQLRNLGQQQQLGQQELIGEQQKNQLQAMQLQDETKLRQLSPQFVQKDDKGTITGYDNKGFFQAAAGAGISQQRLQQIQMGQLQMTEQYAKADEATRNNEIAKNKASYEALEGIRNITDPNQRQQAYQTAIPNLQKMGVDTSKFPAQVPNNDQLQSIEAGIGMHAQILSDAKTAAETNQANQKAHLDEMEANQKGSPLTAMETNPSEMAGDKLPSAMAYLKTKISDPNADPTEKARATRLLSTATVAQQTQLAMDKSKKETDQAIQDGDPNAAGKLLHDGIVAPSQIASARKPEFAQKAFSAAASYGDGWNAEKAEADFKVAGSPANVAFFGSAKSLTDKGGTLDQLKDAGKDIPQGQLPIFNSVADALKMSTGSGPIAKYAAIALGVADDYSKVMGGGNGSDTSRTQALQLISANKSPDQRNQSLDGIRGAVGSQTKSRIGNNAVLKQMYGADESNQGQPSGMTRIKASDGSLHDIPTANLDGARKIDPKLTVVQ